MPQEIHRPKLMGRRKPGRPPIEEGAVRRQLSVSLTESQHEQLGRVAKEKSVFVRSLIERELQRLLGKDGS